MNFLHYGTFSKEFEEDFLATLASDLQTDPLQARIVLVGSNFLGLHLRHALAEKTGGEANVHFVTFVDLAFRLLEKSWIDQGRSLFPPDGEEFLLADLSSALPTGSRFYEVRDQEGFHQALRSTFHDLINGGITSLGKHEGKLGEISRLFSEHRKKYLTRFATTADLILEAASESKQFVERLAAQRLYIYGFYDFTHIQRQLIDAIGRHVPLQAWVPLESSQAIFSSWKSTKISSDQKPSFQFFSSASVDVEAEDLTRYLLESIEKNKLSLHRIAILLRSTDLYLPIFSDILHRAGIPFYREGGKPLATTQIGRALLLLLDFLGTDWKRTDLLSLLSVFPFDAKHLQGLGHRADWDRWTRDAGVTRGLGNFLSRLSSWRTPTPLPEKEKFIPLMRDWFSTFDRLWEHASDPSRFSSELSGFIKKYALPNEEAVATVETIEGIRDLLSFPMEKESHLIQAIRKRILSKGISSGGFERNGLFLGSLESARSIAFDTILIPGLNERVFPAPPQTDPLLLDHERRELNQELHGGMVLKERRLFEERLLFNVTCAQASRELILSYPRMDRANGKELLPSPFYSRRREEVSQEVRSFPMVRWAKRSETILDRSDWLVGHLGAWSLQEGSDAIQDWSPISSAVHRWVSHRLGENLWTEFEGRIDLGGKTFPMVFSPSRLETYATCPYRYFLRELLELEPSLAPDEAEKIRPTDRGSIVHDILFRLFSELRQDKLLPLRMENRSTIIKRLNTIAHEVFRKAEATVPLGHRLIWETDQAFLLSDLQAFIDFEMREITPYLPDDFEVSFGEEKPLTFSLGRRTVQIRGVIDRIDLTSDRKKARVIDYKTGSLRRYKDDRFDGGTTLQLPLYLSALPLLYPGIDIHQTEALLWNTGYSSGFERVSFSGAMLEARRKDLIKLLSTMVEGMATGLFIPRPGKDRKNCATCDFTSICGKNIDSVYLRKMEDASASAIVAMEEIE